MHREGGYDWNKAKDVKHESKCTDLTKVVPDNLKACP